MNFKNATKIYSIPVIALIIAGYVIFGFGRDKGEPVAVVQQAAVVQSTLGQATQVKAINAVAVVPAPTETNAGPRLDKLLAKAQACDLDPTEEDIFPNTVCDLISSTLVNDFIASLRGQAIRWLDTAPELRIKEFPLSAKQLAWAEYYVHPTTSLYPYNIKSVYPNGKPAR